MIFALDVGTRKVTGLLGYVEEDILHVIDFETIEHPYRYMLDGQIHNIEGVAKVISAIKKRLEDRNEIKLEEVAVAVAGRFLKTVVSEAEIDIPNAVIDVDIVKQLELMALSKVPIIDEDGTELQCVGYSAVDYRLDGFWMKSLVGHRGKKAYTKIVAALLPNQVVEAMLMTLKKVGLRPFFMTLEPIAALEISVPEDLRILNIALVDIGAGTSDIAISKAGSIVGYDMVPMAGDEITEVLAQNYLLDFQTAEQVKRRLDTTEYVEALSITNQTTRLNSQEVFESIKQIVQTIAQEIAERIVKLNGGVPSAVLLVGGGAKLSILQREIARSLQIPEGRISLKTVESLDKVKILKEDFKGSEYVTVSGIAYMAARDIGSIYDIVEINGEKVKLLRIGQGQTILHALLQVGFNLNDILGDVRPSLTFRFNGESITIPQRKIGGLRVLLNGSETALYRRLNSGDVLTVEKIPYGLDQECSLSKYVKPFVVIVDGKERNRFFPKVLVNNQLMEDLNYEIKEKDDITVEKIDPHQLVQHLENETEDIHYYYNGEKKQAKRYRYNLVEIKESESETYVIFETVPKTLRDVVDTSKPIKIKLNDSEVTLSRKDSLVMVDGNYVPLDTPLINGMSIVHESYKPIVADIFNLIDFNPKKVKEYVLLVNGKSASFVQELCDGDEVVFKIEEKTD